jgi:hypothetical protein
MADSPVTPPASPSVNAPETPVAVQPVPPEDSVVLPSPPKRIRGIPLGRNFIGVLEADAAEAPDVDMDSISIAASQAMTHATMSMPEKKKRGPRGPYKKKKPQMEMPMGVPTVNLTLNFNGDNKAETVSAAILALQDALKVITAPKSSK